MVFVPKEIAARSLFTHSLIVWWTKLKAFNSYSHLVSITTPIVSGAICAWAKRFGADVMKIYQHGSQTLLDGMGAQAANANAGSCCFGLLLRWCGREKLAVYCSLVFHYGFPVADTHWCVIPIITELSLLLFTTFEGNFLLQKNKDLYTTVDNLMQGGGFVRWLKKNLSPNRERKRKNDIKVAPGILIGLGATFAENFAETAVCCGNFATPFQILLAWQKCIKLQASRKLYFTIRIWLVVFITGFNFVCQTSSKTFQQHHQSS